MGEGSSITLLNSLLKGDGKMKKLARNWLLRLSIVTIVTILSTGVVWSEQWGHDDHDKFKHDSHHKAWSSENILKMIYDLCKISGYDGIQAGLQPGPRLDAAAKYILSKLRNPSLNAHLEPSWYEDVPSPKPLKVEVSVVGGNSIVADTERWSIGTPPEGITAELVYVGPGTEQAFKKVNVAGKIALVDRRAILRYVSPAGSSYTNSQNNAIKYGAVALIMADLFLESPQPRGAGSVSDDGVVTLSTIPVLTCGRSAGDYLVNLATSGNPPKVKIKIDLDPKRYATYSVVAQLKGSGKIDEIIIVQGHYDTMYTGALDNNAGVAAIIGLANYFANQPVHSRNRDMWFVLSTGHDSSFLQLKKFLADHEDIMHKVIVYDVDHPFPTKGEAEINLEIVPTGKDSPVWVKATSKELASLMGFSLQKHGLMPAYVTVHIPGGGASSGRFVDAGTPGTSAPDYIPFTYHTLLDTPDIFSLDGIQRAFPAMIEQVENIDRTPEGYLIYADINQERNVPPEPPKVISVSLFADVVMVGDKAIAWLDSFDHSRMVNTYMQLPDNAGFTWDWGDGTPVIKGGRSFTHVYTKPGTYTLTVTLTDGWGLQGQTTRTITVVNP